MLWLSDELLVMSAGVVVRSRHVFSIALNAHSDSTGHPAASEADRCLASASGSHAAKAERLSHWCVGTTNLVIVASLHLNLL